MFICVAKTSVEWAAFLQGAQQVLGRSLTRSIDKEGWPLLGVTPFVCAIAELQKPDQGDVWSQLRDDLASKKHAMFSFLVNLPRAEFVTLASFGLTVTPADVGDVALVSGRLSDWVQAVVDGTNHKPLRPFSCLLLAWFERESLGLAWEQWEKDHIPQERMYRLVRK